MLALSINRQAGRQAGYLGSARQLAIAWQGGDIKVHIAANSIRVPIGNDALDGGNHLRNEVGGSGLQAGRQAAQGVLQANADKAPPVAVCGAVPADAAATRCGTWSNGN